MGKWHNKRKVHTKDQANHLFQSISGSKTLLWNFQCVICLDKHVEQNDGRKSWVERQNSKTRLKMNEHACSVDTVEEFLLFQNILPICIYKWLALF